MIRLPLAAVLTTAVDVAYAGLAAKPEKATVSPSVMGYGADSTWKPVLRAVTFAAPHVGVRLLCIIWDQRLQRSQASSLDTMLARRMLPLYVEWRVAVSRSLRVVNRWDYVPHVPGGFLETPLEPSNCLDRCRCSPTLLACGQELCTYSRL